MALIASANPSARAGRSSASSVDAVVDAAIELADEEGMEALSMRRIAERLGLKPMSVYTYVPGKAELIDLMVDQVAGEEPLPELDGSLRERLAGRSRGSQWNEYLRHPWLLSIDTSRPPLGPNVSDHWEWCLRAIEGLGLTDLDMDRVITLVTGYVSARRARTSTPSGCTAPRPRSPTRSGGRATPRCSSRSWTPRAYPISGRVGTAAGEEYGAAADPAGAFEFGLARVIDGIEAYVAERGREARAG